MEHMSHIHTAEHQGRLRSGTLPLTLGSGKLLHVPHNTHLFQECPRRVPVLISCFKAAILTLSAPCMDNCRTEAGSGHVKGHSWQSEVYYCTGLGFQLSVMVRGISVPLSFGSHGALLFSVVKETPGFFSPCSLMSAFLFP